MRKIIVIAAIAGLSIYIYVNYKDKIKAKIAPLIPGSTNPVNGDITPTNDRDREVLALLKQVMGEEENYTTTGQYSDAIILLQGALQPVVVNCLVAPCPPAQQVSQAVKDRVNMYIGILNQSITELNNSGKGSDTFFV